MLSALPNQTQAALPGVSTNNISTYEGWLCEAGLVCSVSLRIMSTGRPGVGGCAAQGAPGGPADQAGAGAVQQRGGGAARVARVPPGGSSAVRREQQRQWAAAAVVGGAAVAVAPGGELPLHSCHASSGF